MQQADRNFWIAPAVSTLIWRSLVSALASSLSTIVYSRLASHMHNLCLNFVFPRHINSPIYTSCFTVLPKLLVERGTSFSVIVGDYGRLQVNDSFDRLSKLWISRIKVLNFIFIKVSVDCRDPKDNVADVCILCLHFLCSQYISYMSDVS